MADSEGWGIGESLDALVAAFNRGSLDVPARLFTPRTTFALNGRSYESILGGSPDDPLIRLLARGAAGYRTAAKALQYAEQNINASFAFAADLARARDLKEYLEIQTRYAQKQMQDYAKQAQDLGRMLTEAAQKAKP